jgi:hypothetical protein
MEKATTYIVDQEKGTLTITGEEQSPQELGYDQRLALYAKKHPGRIKMWMDNHPPHMKLPIVESPTGELIWLNREQRRKRKIK